MEVLTAHSNATLLIEQAIRFQPNIVIISDETKYAEVNQALASKDIKVFAGEKSLIDIAGSDTYDVLLAAIVGYAGLSSTLAAIEQGKTVALANKETLVVAGEIQIQPAGGNLKTINYGNGTCDDQATVTINGSTYPITLN